MGHRGLKNQLPAAAPNPNLFYRQLHAGPKEKENREHAPPLSLQVEPVAAGLPPLLHHVAELEEPGENLVRAPGWDPPHHDPRVPVRLGFVRVESPSPPASNTTAASAALPIPEPVRLAKPLLVNVRVVREGARGHVVVIVVVVHYVLPATARAAGLDRNEGHLVPEAHGRAEGALVGLPRVRGGADLAVPRPAIGGPRRRREEGVRGRGCARERRRLHPGAACKRRRLHPWGLAVSSHPDATTATAAAHGAVVVRRSGGQTRGSLRRAKALALNDWRVRKGNSACALGQRDESDEVLHAAFLTPLEHWAIIYERRTNEATNDISFIRGER